MRFARIAAFLAAGTLAQACEVSHPLVDGHRVDALACPRCHGRLRLIAVVMERAAIRRVLDHLGESATGPPPVRVLDAWAG